MTSPPPLSPTSVSSEEHSTTATTAQHDTLPPPELNEMRSLSRNSNYTSISSAASCEDIQVIQSPEHALGQHDSEVTEFPSARSPANTSIELSASNIYLDVNTSVPRSPSIFIDVFDSKCDNDRASPTAELCAADNIRTDEVILDAGTNQVVSKRGSATSGTILGRQSDLPDIDVLSQEILNEISMVGMSLNEEQFNELADEYSPMDKHNKESELSVLDQLIYPLKHDYSSDFNSSSNMQQKQSRSSDSSIHNSIDTFPSALIPNKDMDTGPLSPSSTSSSRLRVKDGYHEAAHKTIASKVADDNSQYYVHISPYASDNDSPKSTKRNYTSSIASHPLHNSRESPKSARQKHHSSPAAAMEYQWHEISPQLSDEPNEEFVLPPPPQFQGDDSSSNQMSSSVQPPPHDNMTTEPQSQRTTKRLVQSTSASHIQTSADTGKQQRSLKTSRYSASHLMEMGNMDEEVLLTDMLKSLDQMAEKKYHEEMEHRNALKERRAFTAESKAEKSEKKKQKKKGLKRRSTVGIYNFDDLIRQSIQENQPVRDEEYPHQPADDCKANDDSKVRKLAREYSKRVRERQLFNIKKRFSVHSYENFSGSEPSTPEGKPKEPLWKMVADANRESYQGPQRSPVAKRLPTIVSGSTGIGLPARNNDDCTIVANDYATQSPTKFIKQRSSPVMVRSSSPIRSRIEGYEKLSQSKDEYPVPRRVESANPVISSARGKSFNGSISLVKSQENLANIHLTSNGDKREKSRRQTASAGHGLNSQSRELSKSHGSLNPLSTNSKSYRGLSVFSPETLDESDIIYKPPVTFREDYEHIRTRGGFKGWVKNLVDKFSK